MNREQELTGLLRRVYEYVPIPDQVRIDVALSQQTELECRCTMRQRLVGDGCSVCNPEYAEDHEDEPAPAQDEREAHVPDKVFQDEFQVWWEDHGQFCRAGGGDYERTFAFQAWRHLYPMLLQARATRPAQTEQQPILAVKVEDDCVEHVHPEYGGGYFFTEDAIVEMYAARPAQTEQQPVTGEQLAWWKEHLSVHLAILFRANGESMAEAERSAARVIRDAERIAPIAQTTQGDDQ